MTFNALPPSLQRSKPLKTDKISQPFNYQLQQVQQSSLSSLARFQFFLPGKFFLPSLQKAINCKLDLLDSMWETSIWLQQAGSFWCAWVIFRLILGTVSLKFSEPLLLSRLRCWIRPVWIRIIWWQVLDVMSIKLAEIYIYYLWRRVSVWEQSCI